mmetsp:Transcript_61592/g.130003  ORF Transcript_61592/g.130003 Transcript_61592/m.130003 type:complete len:226 (-) Transcript_61592:1336-2013(-)
MSGTGSDLLRTWGNFAPLLPPLPNPASSRCSPREPLLRRPSPARRSARHSRWKWRCCWWGALSFHTSRRAFSFPGPTCGGFRQLGSAKFGATHPAVSQGPRVRVYGHKARLLGPTPADLVLDHPGGRIPSSHSFGLILPKSQTGTTPGAMSRGLDPKSEDEGVRPRYLGLIVNLVSPRERTAFEPAETAQARTVAVRAAAVTSCCCCCCYRYRRCGCCSCSCSFC